MTYIYIAIEVYLIIGIAMTFMLLQTPYAENPLWVMILFWPFYLYDMMSR